MVKTQKQKTLKWLRKMPSCSFWCVGMEHTLKSTHDFPVATARCRFHGKTYRIMRENFRSHTSLLSQIITISKIPFRNFLLFRDFYCIRFHSSSPLFHQNSNWNKTTHSILKLKKTFKQAWGNQIRLIILSIRSRVARQMKWLLPYRKQGRKI